MENKLMTVRITATLLVLCLPSWVMAQQENPTPPGNQSKPEEIVIIGDQFTLRKKMLAAERNAYDVFNKFNDDKRFMISCSESAPINSHLTRQLCEPEFKIQATAGHARDFLASLRDNSTDSNGNPVDIQVPTHEPMEIAIGRQLPAYQKKMKQVAEQHPEFVEAIKQYSKLREQYEGAVKADKK